MAITFSDYIAACPPRECDGTCMWVKDSWPDGTVLRCIMCDKWTTATEARPNDDAAVITKLALDRARIN